MATRSRLPFVHETVSSFSAQESSVLVTGHAEWFVFGFVTYRAKLQLKHIGFHLVDHRQCDQCGTEFLPSLALGQFLVQHLDPLIDHFLIIFLFFAPASFLFARPLFSPHAPHQLLNQWLTTAKILQAFQASSAPKRLNENRESQFLRLWWC